MSILAQRSRLGKHKNRCLCQCLIRSFSPGLKDRHTATLSMATCQEEEGRVA